MKKEPVFNRNRTDRGGPNNPGLRDLISNKRRYSSPPDRDSASEGFRGWQERGYLPHRDEPGLVQFVTIRLADSYPAALRSEWASLLEITDQRERRKELEAYLDLGRGERHLQRPEIGALVDEALRFNHGKSYDLRAWVVMPNHLHALFKVGSKSMSRIVAEWKVYTARQANRILGRRGPFWANDYWDTYMRARDHELRTCRYIERNPAKPLLVRDPKEWPWSSARYRDDYGRLHL